MAGIDLAGVVKEYDNGFKAVKGIDLDIGDGEFLVLVGPSGCGKSTTLRMIAGLEEITGGTISIAGKVVNTVHPKDRDIAMVFQNYALYPHMTVEKNMAFSLKLRGMPKAEIDQRVHEAAEMLGLTELLARKPKRLSGGQRQRVALGRAVVREPKAFLFDEPLSNLDAKLRTTTRGELKALHQRLKTTTVYVTHDQEEAMTLGDRIVVMKDGEIQQADTPFEVYTNPANLFVAQFIGTPPMNILPGRIENGGFIEDGTTDPIKLAGALAELPDGQYNLGIRPQFYREQQPGQSGSSMELTPTVVEPLGDLMDVSARTGGGRRVVARIPAHANLPIEKPVRFAIEIERCHLFEHLGTGKNLTLAQPAIA